jgi:hypothetical protein
LTAVGSVISSTNRDDIRAAVRSQNSPYYVYILRRPSGEPFYVGKGTNDRVLAHVVEALNTDAKTHKLNIIRAIFQQDALVTHEIESFHEREEGALGRERVLIAHFGRHDLKLGPLANLTDGGETGGNPSEESKQKHRDTLYGDVGDDERSIANRFFKSLATVQSVPIKPVQNFKAVHLTPMKKAFTKPTPRMAAALAASAIANRVLLVDGCVIPRRLRIADTDYIIENGVGKDILLVNLAELVPANQATDEAFRLSVKAIEYVVSTVGRDLLLDAGILMPAW